MRATAFAPASVGNVAIGFDILGFAVDALGDRVTVARREGRGGGLAGEEDIKVFQLKVEDLFGRLAQGAIDDPKLAIAAYWLKDNIDRL